MKIQLLSLMLLLSSALFSQKLPNKNIYFSVQPSLNSRIMLYENNQFKDSFRKTDKFSQTISFNIYKPIQIRSNLLLFIGLQYQDMGFKRKIENIRFLDTIHPSLGVRFDQVEIGPSWVEFRYRYHYLSIPFFFSKEIKRKRKGRPGSIHLLGGGAISGLLNQDINAVFYGFTFKGNKSIKFNEDNVSASQISANMQLGFRYENKLDRDILSIFIQPKLILPLLPANYGQNMHLLYSIGAEFGLKVNLGKTEQ